MFGMAAIFWTTTITDCFEQIGAYCTFLLNSSTQVKTMILTWLNINPELLIKLVASTLSIWART